MSDFSREQLIKQIEVKRELMRRDARDDPNAFMQYVFSDADGRVIKQAWFHKDWQRLMTEERRLQIIAARDHGKTTQVIGRTLYELGKNPNLRIKLVCQSDAKARDRLGEIKTHIEKNKRLRAVFPELRPGEGGTWTKHQITVDRKIISKDPSIEAQGVLSSATGGRADLVIFDDIVDRRNALEQVALRDQVKRAFKSDWSNLLEPQGRAWYICTLWHEDDNSHEVIQNPEYKTVWYNVDDVNKPLWAEKWGAKELAAKLREIGILEFDRGYRNKAYSGEVALVQEQWIRYYRHLPRDRRFIVVQAHDLALGKTRGSDFFAAVTLAIDAESLPIKIYVIHARNYRLSFLKQVEFIKDYARRFNADFIGIESVQYQEGLADVLRETTPLPIRRLKPIKNKATRLQAVSPFIENGQVLFSKKLDPAFYPRPDVKGGEVVTQLLRFPVAKHDDLLDALVYAMLIVQRYIGGVGDGTDAPEQDGDVRVMVIK